MMSLAIFSQTVTNKTQVHCFPDSIVKKVAKDLLRGDSARAELTETKILVHELELKNFTNERLVNTYVHKVANYSSQIDLYRQKEVKYVEMVTGLEKDVKKEKKKNKIFKIVTGILITSTVIGFVAQ
jgi:hypothetical protein